MAEQPDAAPAGDSASAEDLKAGMRAALERKRQHRHPHERASAHDGKVDHTHGAAGGKRTFRRKSG